MMRAFVIRFAVIVAFALLVAAPRTLGEDAEPPPPEPPYTEGWHGGSPPGEHVAIRGDLWAVDRQRVLLEVGHGPRTRAVVTGDLGEPTTGDAGGLGFEVYSGKTGWISLDWWMLQSRGFAALARDIQLDGTTFAQGTLVTSEVTQHLVKIRDGLDIRYRIPFGPETWLDLNFGPVTALVIRYESFSVGALGAGPRSSDALLAVSLTPGLRAGVDLRVIDELTFRLGSDVDLLPHLAHNPLSFTRAPSLDAWADASGYIAARFLFVELSIGWRYYRSLASGGKFRQAATQMSGVFAELAARF
jgi:hypothetical protein